MDELRFRQIHMDFHTSEMIEKVGSEFDPEEFANILVRAKVNSVTCFARCHHGWLYYDSKIFPERVHPHLANKNLLKEQIEACHKNGINVPVYTTIQWDHLTAQQHPEWVVMQADGKLSGTDSYEPGFYRTLCINTPYREFLKTHTKEVLEMLPIDGLFFDIVMLQDCSCHYCQQGMKMQGMDPARKDERLMYATMVNDNFKLELSNFVQEFNRNCSLFYNRGHIGPYVRESQNAYTHFELESLPSSQYWGYMHFPMSIRYTRTLGHDCLSLSGRFHTEWGDFHSFKNKAALEFECFNMLALNAKCSIGDQLLPSGKISQRIYDLIGSIYTQVEQKEPWCRAAKAVTEVGLMTTEEWTQEMMPAAVTGALRMLQEGAHQFDILDSKSDFNLYKLIILPDDIPVDDILSAKISDYLANGGKLIASFESGLNLDKTAFNINELGVTLQPEQEVDSSGNLVRGRFFDRNDYAEYLIPKGKVAKDLPEIEHAMYMKGIGIDIDKDVTVLADVVSSYFDRTWKSFCSHRQTPSSGRVSQPGIVCRNNVIFFSHPIFTLYEQRAPLWCKRLVLNAIDMLLPESLVRHNGPSTLLVTINEQKEQNRWVIHLLHYIPERRCVEFDIIEDVIPLYNIELSCKLPTTIKSLRSVPQLEHIDFEEKLGRIHFIVPKIEGHQMIEIGF